MKRSFIQIGLFVLVVSLVSTGFSSKNGVDLSHYIFTEESVCYNVPNEDEVVEEEAEDFFQLYLGKTYVGFKEAIGFKESQGRYRVINEFGYMGKYQFGKSTLKMIGIYNTQDFLTDTRLQEEAFTAYASRNKWILRRDIKRYVGRSIGGVKVTESGILAAAHLAGAGNVKKYLRSGGSVNFQDAFGTSIRYYLKKFSGYDTSLIVPNRKAKVL
ncbi:peptidoglycan-binding protein LysM [Aureisphaera galaxeae]|uniref:peptidoglycan-binding protein LysM n=1 Tax=Aureisphaera galaxeae TaxID=1538023 RepID=UPI00234FC52C|nr:peptidoglycan-binding protein LysM [Aureisphaera galaxeae]MDC8004989.1 peptidoglycan-binding protein LysM [Aureisphaera galaxeae]